MRLENKSATETKNILGEDMLPLNDIAEKVFNITPRIAQRKAATRNTCPSRPFASTAPEKGLYVLREDLEKWIKDRADRAKDQHRKDAGRLIFCHSSVPNGVTKASLHKEIGQT